jgi:O-antigen ligase
MTPSQGGWRSARHVAPPPQAARTSAAAPRGAAQGVTPAPTRGARIARGAKPAAGPSIFTGLKGETAKWSVSFVATLAYIYAAVTYGLPLVTPAMIIAVLGLTLERDRIVVPMFLVVFALYVLWAAVGYTSSYEPAGTIDQITVLSKIVLIAFVVSNVTRDSWRMRIFMIFFLACFALYPARGTLVNYFVAGYTVFGRALWNYIYRNANDLAALTFFPLALSVAGAVREYSKWIKRAAYVGMGVLPLIILLTQSRGALIGLVVSSLLFFVAYSKGKRIRSLLAGAAVAAVIVPFVPTSAWQRFELMKNLTGTENLGDVDPEGSAQERYNIWRVAGTIIRENPVAGIGLGAYPRAHATYAPRLGVPKGAIGFRDTHSTYLNVAAETGLPGLFLFLATIGTVAVSCERVRRKAKGTPRAPQLLALELGLLAFLIAGLFGSFSKLSYLYLQLATMWALADITKRELAAAAGAVPMRGGRETIQTTARMVRGGAVDSRAG